MGIFIPSYPRGGFTSNRFPRKSYPKKVTFMFKAEDVWSAAAAATRMNGGYLKVPRYEQRTDDNGYQFMVETAPANKVLVRKLLDANQGWTEEDVARGAEARAYWQGQMLKMLGSAANDFEQTAVKMANKEEIDSNFDVAVISSLIVSAQRGQARDKVADVKYELNSQHVGKLEDRVTFKGVEVLNVGGLTEFGKYRVEAKFEGNLFAWWSGKTYTVGEKLNIKGRVKGHIKDKTTNVAVTQLNYVKEI
jgi:hypothetical protein